VPECFLREAVADDAITDAIVAAYGRPATVTVVNDVADPIEPAGCDLLCVRRRLAGDWRLHLDVLAARVAPMPRCKGGAPFGLGVKFIGAGR
jgi:hypothetical protein